MSNTFVLTAEQLDAGIDSVIGFDLKQCPTDPSELNARLSHPQDSVTQALMLVRAQGAGSSRVQRFFPYVYALLEAAAKAYPGVLTEPVRLKAYVTALAAVTSEARAAGNGVLDPLPGTLLDHPSLAARLRELFSDLSGLNADEKSGVWALMLGTVRALARAHRGDDTPVRVAPQPGRNDACPCGSGKKYKKCCATTGPAIR